MSSPSVASTIFCCETALPVQDPSRFKVHNDPNRDRHAAIVRSFRSFAVRRQHAADLLCLIMGIEPESSSPGGPDEFAPRVAPAFNREALQNNPLTAETPYVIHLTSRHDFGPVYSHRYFACPANLDKDWKEVSLLQWFASGEAFKMKAAKWDLKCKADARFFRLTLRPNLEMRGCYPLSRGGAGQVDTIQAGVLQPAESVFGGESSGAQFMPSPPRGARQGESVAVGGTRSAGCKPPWTTPNVASESVRVWHAAELRNSCLGAAHSVGVSSRWPARKVGSESAGTLQAAASGKIWGAGIQPSKFISPWTAQNAESESTDMLQAAAESGESWSREHRLGESLLNSLVCRNSPAAELAPPWNVPAEPPQQPEPISPWNVKPDGSVAVLRAAALGFPWNMPPADVAEALPQAEMVSPWEIKQGDLAGELQHAAYAPLWGRWCPES